MKNLHAVFVCISDSFVHWTLQEIKITQSGRYKN